MVVPKMKKRERNLPLSKRSFLCKLLYTNHRASVNQNFQTAGAPGSVFLPGGCLFLSKLDGWSGRSFFLVGDHRSEDTKLVIHR